ncbi:MAG: PqqD family protein [Bacteroidetes bacterium]|nr:PqqD family protein [Bacteroidota bacterium]
MKINKNVAISEAGSLFHPLTGDFFTLNPSGVEIFKMLKNEKTYNEIMQEVLAKYDTDKNTFERDYYEFTALLRKFKLVEAEN